MTNTELLKEKIKSSGYRNAYLAECLGISLQAFLNKVNNKNDFKVPEMCVLSEMLKLNEEERDAVFFAKKVDETATV